MNFYSMDTRYEYEDWMEEQEEQFLLEDLESQHEIKHISIPSNTLIINDTIELDIATDDTEQKIVVSRNSRCVPVGTILSAPPGRREKKSGKGKSETIKFRCSNYEKKMLNIKATACGLKLSEYIRRVALEKHVIQRLTEEEIDLYKMLVKYHNNFKSIGNMFKKRNPKLMKEVYDLAHEIKSHFKKFNK